jgi:hypothetical protein
MLLLRGRRSLEVIPIEFILIDLLLMAHKT